MAASPKKRSARQQGLKPARASKVVHARKDVEESALRKAIERCRQLEHRANLAAIQRAELLAVATHDLRNPLGVVLVTSTLFGRESVSPHQLEHLAAIRRAATEMSQVIEDLMDGASIDDGQLDLDLSECDPVDLVRDAVEAARMLVGEREIAVEYRVGEGLSLLNVDRHRLMQVFSRIFANALRFMPKSGTIVIEAVREARGVSFSVLDSGPAIPESQRPYAFLRRPPPGRRVCRGTGLGMFVVKGIIEAHGGRVALTSDSERGNRVSFTLPMQGAEERIEV